MMVHVRRRSSPHGANTCVQHNCCSKDFCPHCVNTEIPGSWAGKQQYWAACLCAPHRLEDVSVIGPAELIGHQECRLRRITFRWWVSFIATQPRACTTCHGEHDRACRRARSRRNPATQHHTMHALPRLSAAPSAGQRLRAAAVPAMMSLAAGSRSACAAPPAFAAFQASRIPMPFAVSGLNSTSGADAGSLGAGSAAGEVAESTGEGGSSAVSTGSTSDSNANALPPRRKKRKL